MKPCLSCLFIVAAAALLFAGCAGHSCCQKKSAASAAVVSAAATTNAPDFTWLKPDERVLAVINRIKVASAGAQTISADFTYAVTSIKRQQLITGKVQMMKPNFARFTYNYMAEPAFPNPIGADGQKIYTFTPKSFLPNRTFSKEPFDSILGAQQASGQQPGGGIISSSPVEPLGRNIHLWDGIPLQALLNPETALHYLYFGNLSELIYEGEKAVDGVSYTVIYHHYKTGSIAGGENSEFDQRLYVGEDGFVHMYVLEFKSGGVLGVQVTRLSNLQTNLPMTKEMFAFTPPMEK